MTKAAWNLLGYLHRYLKENPKRVPVLRKLYLAHTGEELPMVYLWRHTARKNEPTLSIAIVYIVFLIAEGEFPKDSLNYKNREWLKAKK